MQKAKLRYSKQIDHIESNRFGSGDGYRRANQGRWSTILLSILNHFEVTHICKIFIMHLSSKDTPLHYYTQNFCLFWNCLNVNRITIVRKAILNAFLKIINYVRILMFKKGLRNNRNTNNKAKPRLTVRMRLRYRSWKIELTR